MLIHLVVGYFLVAVTKKLFFPDYSIILSPESFDIVTDPLDKNNPKIYEFVRQVQTQLQSLTMPNSLLATDSIHNL